MRHRKFSRERCEEMMSDGTIKDAPSIAAFGLLLLHERK